MFKLFFKRQAVPAPVAPQPKRRAPASASAPAPAPIRAGPGPVRTAPVFHEPPPVPEVTEDHDESAWDLWEQSQYQLDSQMGELSPSHSIRVKEDRSSQMGDLDDPFRSVSRNDK